MLDSKDMSFDAVISRKPEIIKDAVGIDYGPYESGSIAFDYEKMMTNISYTFEDVTQILKDHGASDTPILELRNLSALVRKYAAKGYGARICIKDEAANISGSFKARRAALSVYHAKKNGYTGVVVATSGNYGAAVAAQAAMAGLKCIVVQECYDSKGLGQPEIIEKARACEALGAEVIQLTVGPELFYTVLMLLEKTGYFNASLSIPFSIAGVETLGYEIPFQCKAKFGKDADYVIASNAGGGNLTGTARGLLRAGSKAKVAAASVNLTGLHMASDTKFNKKSFTTSHTGFGMPFATYPDKTDLPRSASRPLRYMDMYFVVSQGEVFYITEALASLEGLERGPAGNTALAAAFSLAKELPEDQIIVVQETEYTGAGKHVQAQLSFARSNGIEILFGDPADEIPGKNIILPKDPSYFKVKTADLDHMRKSLIRNSMINHNVTVPTEHDIEFLAEETKTNTDYVKKVIAELKEKESL
jgi:cysteine synthase